MFILPGFLDSDSNDYQQLGSDSNAFIFVLIEMPI